MLFSYVMLCDFYPMPVPKYDNDTTHLGLSISIPEIVLIIWIIMFTVDEVRQVYFEQITKFNNKKI